MTATGVPVRYSVDWGPGLSLSVHNLGLACCAVEVVAAGLRRSELLAHLPPTGGPQVSAEVLVVAGTVTDKLAPSVLELYAGFASPPYVVSFGACASSGGPYWDSYCVTKGVDQLIPVDVYVPGCPPRPEALLHALLDLQKRILQ